MKGPVAFFFLGETLLIPHLFPVVEALAKHEVAIDLWVSTSVHEELLGRWIGDIGPATIRIRKAPFFRSLPEYHDGRNPPLPPKIFMLLCLVPHLRRTPVVVSVEQTSLWLPALLPLRSRFINIMHGSGTVNARGGVRRRSAWRMPVPSENEQREFLRRGFDARYVPVVGPVKPSFRHATKRHIEFPAPRPVVLYTPHWQQHRSSWWDWGQQVVQMLVRQQQFNVILAPHQRLIERAPDLRQALDAAAQHAHVHCDIDSFAMVDGSYTACADIYLGDTSSQVIEFLTRPRPCVFLNNHHFEWMQRPDLVMWKSGEVVESLEAVLPALSRAAELHQGFRAAQQELVRGWLGDGTGAPERIVQHILEALER